MSAKWAGLAPGTPLGRPLHITTGRKTRRARRSGGGTCGRDAGRPAVCVSEMISSTQAGILYVVATPLGNLEDLSFRALRVLGEVGLIAAEDTRRTVKLLAHYGLQKPLRALHGDSSPGDIAALVGLLRQGQSVAYVSEAGTPGVSDPGAALVQAAREADVAIVPIPGPAAATAAFSISGLSATGFVFGGFVPRKRQEAREFLARWTAQELPLVVFESPQRILETLRELAALVPERQIIIARELTKQFEQTLACPAVEAPQALAPEQVRGEFTLVIAGAPSPPPATSVPEEKLAEAVALLREAEVPRKTIAQILQILTPLSRNEAYRRAGGLPPRGADAAYPSPPGEGQG